MILIDKYERKILTNFIKKYESSKSFIGSNKVKQNFKIKIEKLFPNYMDDADYDTFVQVNDAIVHLERLEFIQAAYQGNNSVVENICLKIESMDNIYSYMDIVPRKELQEKLQALLLPYSRHENELGEYTRIQLRRIEENKQVEYFTGDYKELSHVLKASEFLIENQAETYKRDVSVRIFGDSKRLEEIQGKVQGLLYQYGNYEEKEFILEECGVVNTPTYVILKGFGRLKFLAQEIDLSLLESDIGISTNTIKELQSICINGNKVITIENLTTFHDYRAKDEFVIYLGGFHNQVKTQFLKLLYEQNKDKKYVHFGDIDAGGFYIYKHLLKKTEIPFTLYKMNVTMLEEHKKYWKKISDNDRKRLKKLLEEVRNASLGDDYTEVIEYMLTHGCKLEQEVIMLNS